MLTYSMKRLLCLSLIMSAFLTSLLGCGTLPSGRGWGQDAIYPASSRKVSSALYDACLDWQTLIPAGGAVAAGTLDHFDRRASDWVSDRNPLFGSQDSASRAANYLLAALEAEVLLTALATPSGGDPKQWTYAKGKGLTVVLAAELATITANTKMKDITERSRPSGVGKSLPSGHSSVAFASAALANRNLDSIPMSENLRFALQAGNVLLAATTAWARLEAHAHFPSDVLAGAALGHFFSTFMYDAFMGLEEKKPFSVNVLPTNGGAALAVSFPF